MTPVSLPRDDVFSPGEIAAAAKALGATGGSTGAARLLSVLYDADVDLAEVTRCLSAEPALVARVLKVANSPFYRRAGTVGTVDRAVQVLGLAAIRGVAAAGCMERIPIPALAGVLDAERFRRHSLAVAVAAQALSARARCGVDSEAFMAGLLHDIGIVLAMRLWPPTPAGAAVARGEPDGSVHALADHIGAHHAFYGARLVEAWSLPGWLGASIDVHHAAPWDTSSGPSPGGLQVLPALLSLGEAIAASAGFGLGLVCTAMPAPDVVAALGLDAADCDEVAGALPDGVGRLLDGL